eukprot:scaffold56570_cov34-Tisochrysis_lutea.AAC.3
MRDIGNVKKKNMNMHTPSITHCNDSNVVFRSSTFPFRMAAICGKKGHGSIRDARPVIIA